MGDVAGDFLFPRKQRHTVKQCLNYFSQNVKQHKVNKREVRTYFGFSRKMKTLELIPQCFV